MSLKIVTPAEVSAMHFDPVDPKAREQAAAILETVKSKAESRAESTARYSAESRGTTQQIRSGRGATQ